MAGRRSGFGSVTRLPSGRYRARYTVPGRTQVWVNAPHTFDTRGDAEMWLSRERVKITDGVVRPEAVVDRTTLTEYAERWLANRRTKHGASLRPSTERVYRIYLDKHIAPTIGHLRLTSLTPDVVEDWYATLAPGRPTVRARTYSFLKTVLDSAIPKKLRENPCQVHGAANVEAAVSPRPATLDQLDDLAAAMPERLRLAVLLGAWAQLRSGEVLELRRGDITPEAVTVSRGATFIKGKVHVGPPKTAAGARTVALPPHVAREVTDHLGRWVGPDPDALLFPAAEGGTTHMHQRTLGRHLKDAATAAGLPETFRFHWLRHTGLTMAAQAGATVAELQARAGHKTASTVMRYQHAVAQRDRNIAARLSELAGRQGGETSS